MSIVNDVLRIKNAKADIAAAIIGKGVEVPDGTLIDGFPALISEIQGASYPPDPCTNLSIEPDNESLAITWTDPVDIVFNGVQVNWSGTRLVRKEAGYPVSPEDGTLVVDSVVRNQYQAAGYVDGGLANGTEYFYTVFPYSSDGAYGKGAHISGIPVKPEYSKVLSENSWDKIAKASLEGKAESLWSIGDEIQLSLEGYYDGNPTLQIADFNHDILASDNTKKAGITFICKVLSNERVVFDTTKETVWAETEMFRMTLPELYENLPVLLRNEIKEVVKINKYNNGETKESINKLFLMSETECCDNVTFSVDGEGEKYPVFSDDNSSRTGKAVNSRGDEYTVGSLLRSQSKENTNDMVAIGSNGSFFTVTSMAKGAIRFGFCV